MEGCGGRARADRVVVIGCLSASEKTGGGDGGVSRSQVREPEKWTSNDSSKGVGWQLTFPAYN